MTESVAPDRSIIFAEPPVAGRGGARMAPPLSADEAARAYEACLHDVVHLAARERGRIEIWFDGRVVGAAYFDDWFPHLRRCSQSGGGAGRWLARAFEAAFDDDGRRAIVLVSDVPAPPAGVLGAAFAALRDVDAVLGPTRGGGWYAIGLRASSWPRAARLFGAREEGDGPTARALLRRAAAADVSTRVLPGTYRLENVTDLRRAYEDVAPDSNLGRWLATPAARPYIDA